MKFFIFVILFVLIGIIIPVYFFDDNKSHFSMPSFSLNKLIGPTTNKKDPPTNNSTENEQTNNIKLFYYNAKKDSDGSGSAKAVIAVMREMPLTKTPIKDSLKMLFEGKLTREEKDSGFSTEFPHKTFELRYIKLDKGILTLTFSDPDNFTCGGSYRVEIIRDQITKTAAQFPGVKKVIILPDTLFQP